jgi:DNA-binding transcriptional MerR regulator
VPTTAPGGAASVRKRGANVLNEPHLVAFRGPVRPRGGRRSDRNHEPSWFSASELASRSGVPVATIHHYLRRGLLPPPKALGRHRFLFDDSHLEALLLVRQLRERRLSLPVIRELLPELLASRRAPAFRDEMWDELVAQHVAEHGPAHQRGQLVKLALEAFGARGFDGVQVAELCDRAGIAKGSFYKAFASKE